MKSGSFAFACLLCIAGCSSSAPQPIFLGHVAVTSGSEREAGQAAILGMRLAIEEAARGEVKPLGRPVQVLHTDVQEGIDGFESQAVRLVKVNRAVALYGGRVVAEVQRLERARVPLVTPANLSPRKLGEHVFSIGLSPAFQGRALASFVADNKKLQPVLVLQDERGEEAQALVEAFERELAKDGLGKAASLRSMTFGKETKLADLARNIADSTPKAVLFAGNARDLEQVRRELSQPKPLLLFGGDDGTVRVAKQGETILIATAFAVDVEVPKTQEFSKKFRAAFQEDADVHAALAYDGVRLQIEAMLRMESGESLADSLARIKDFSSVTGPVSFGTDRILRRPAFVVQINGTKATLIKRLDP